MTPNSWRTWRYSFLVGFGRGDDEQGDDFPVGPLVLADAEVGELKELLIRTRCGGGLRRPPIPRSELLAVVTLTSLALARSRNGRWPSAATLAFLVGEAPRALIGAAFEQRRVRREPAAATRSRCRAGGDTGLPGGPRGW